MVEKVVEGRQETGQRLAGPGRGDEQCGTAAAPRPEHGELVFARGPAFLREPIGDEGVEVHGVIRFCSL
jgi:hypothetical protein